MEHSEGDFTNYLTSERKCGSKTVCATACPREDAVCDGDTALGAAAAALTGGAAPALPDPTASSAPWGQF